MYFWWSLCSLYLHACQVRVPLMEFMYLVFIRMQGEIYRRRLKSLLLYMCYVFRALIIYLVCWFCTSALGLILFEIFDRTKCLFRYQFCRAAAIRRVSMAGCFLLSNVHKVPVLPYSFESIVYVEIFLPFSCSIRFEAHLYCRLARLIDHSVKVSEKLREWHRTIMTFISFTNFALVWSMLLDTLWSFTKSLSYQFPTLHSKMANREKGALKNVYVWYNRRYSFDPANIKLMGICKAPRLC